MEPLPLPSQLTTDRRRPTARLARIPRVCAGLVLGFILIHVPAPAQERVTRLTTSGARNGQAFFSPHGAHISFVSDREKGWQVWVAATDGTGLRRLTDEAYPVGWPSWSHDGSEVLFYGRRGGRYRLFRVDVASGSVVRFDARDPEAFRPLLDPGGDRLLFDAVDPATNTGHDIFVRDLRSDTVLRIVQDPGYDSDARWSPDGRRIVFHSDRGAERFHTQVYVMTRDGQGVRALTRGSAVNGYPSWSPNGRCVVYTSEEAGNRDLWVVGADGGSPERLTWSEGFDGDPVWRPEGGRILFSTDRFGGIELAYLDVATALARRCEA